MAGSVKEMLKKHDKVWVSTQGAEYLLLARTETEGGVSTGMKALVRHIFGSDA